MGETWRQPLCHSGKHHLHAKPCTVQTIPTGADTGHAPGLNHPIYTFHLGAARTPFLSTRQSPAWPIQLRKYHANLKRTLREHPHRAPAQVCCVCFVQQQNARRPSPWAAVRVGPPSAGPFAPAAPHAPVKEMARPYLSRRSFSEGGSYARGTSTRCAAPSAIASINGGVISFD